MKKLVSVLVLGSFVSSVYAWTDASINYYQPIAAYEALKEADTNSSKNSVSEHKIQNDFKVVTNISGEPYANEGTHESNKGDIKAFKDVMLNNQFYPFLLALNSSVPEQVSTAEFVMILKEMHSINRNLELILKQMSAQHEVRP